MTEKLDYKKLRREVGRWNKDDEPIEEIDLIDLPTAVPKCEGCDCPSVCEFTDKHHKDDVKTYYICAKHKYALENIFWANSMDYEVRYI